MSAFILKNKTINNIVSVLAHDEFMVRRINEKFDIDVKKTSGKSLLAHRLYSLNVSGVASRYGSAGDMVGEGFKFELEYDCGNLEAYKNLRTLIYQCSEGDVVETKLYKFMDNEATKHLASEIITNLSEYKDIDWG